MDLRDRSLAELRERVAALRSPSALRRWAHLLAADPRAGAQALAAGCRREAQKVAAERARLQRMFELRERLRADGARAIAGVDEVGVGPLAGPVVAAAVALPDRVRLDGLNDSKQVPRAARERLNRAIRAQALGVGVGVVEPIEIDRLNIYHAALEAMRRAVVSLCETLEVDHLLVDARTVPGVTLDQTPLIGGDARDASIAAASIVAKVHRDRIMEGLDRLHTGYGFAAHKGYGTPVHLEALRRLGPCPVHRRSFAPVAAAMPRHAGSLARRSEAGDAPSAAPT